MVGAVFLCHSFCHVAVRIDNLIRTVSKQELGMHIPVCLADDIFSAHLLHETCYLKRTLKIGADAYKNQIEIVNSECFYYLWVSTVTYLHLGHVID